MTRVSFITSASPGSRYSIMSRNTRCSGAPPVREHTISRLESRGSTGVCAISRSGRS